MENLDLKEYLKWLKYQTNEEKELLKEILPKKITELNNEEAKFFGKHLKKVKIIRKLEERLKGNKAFYLEYDLRSINLDDLINSKLKVEEKELADNLIKNNNIDLENLINNYDNLNIIDTYIVYKLRKKY